MEKTNKLTLTEQSHNAWLAMIQAKKRGDDAEAERLTEFILRAKEKLRENLVSAGKKKRR